MAIHQQPVSIYVESEIPEGMTLGAYRFRNVNRLSRERSYGTPRVTAEEARRLAARAVRYPRHKNTPAVTAEEVERIVRRGR